MNQPSLQETSQPPKRPKNKLLTILEFGSLEIFFVVILLSLLLFVLNYFNILRFSSLLPPAVHPTTQSEKIYTKNDLFVLLHQLLQDEYFPQSSLPPSQDKRGFTLQWQKGTDTFWTQLTIAPSQLAGRLLLEIKTQENASSMLNATLATTLSKTFLNQNLISTSWLCSQIKQKKRCQQIHKTATQTQGIEVATDSIMHPTNFIILICSAPAASSFYENPQSCL